MVRNKRVGLMPCGALTPPEAWEKREESEEAGKKERERFWLGSFHEESPARLGENVRIMSGAHWAAETLRCLSLQWLRSAATGKYLRVKKEGDCGELSHHSTALAS